MQVYRENPFLDLLRPEMRRKTEVLYDGKKVSLVNRETGEVEDNQIAVARVKFVESEQFVKVYTRNMSAFFELGKPGQRVCEFMLDQVADYRNIQRDCVFLYYLEYVEWCKAEDRPGTNKVSFNRGIRELAAKGLIAKSARPNQWFINPAVVFNGDRARFITEIRKKQSKMKELEEEGQTAFALEDT